jgi:hypothetical protein
MNPIDKFQTTISSLITARTLLSLHLSSGRAEVQARAYSVQGLYLMGIRAFEGFLEDQIHSLATKKIRWSSREVDGIRHRCSNRLQEYRSPFVKELMLRGKDYADYLPYEKTKDLSTTLFTGGRPFTILPQSDQSTLRRCLKVRNYIAHRSEAAKEKFVKEYRNIKPIRVSNPLPIHYLDDQIRANVSLFEHDLSQLAAISNFLS